MPVPTSDVSWWGSLIWLLIVAAASFGVAWLSGTRLHVRKGLYVPLLLAVTAGLTAGYVAWLGVDVSSVITTRWGWGVLGAMIAAALLVVPASRQPVDRPLHGKSLSAAIVWEGVVYGTAEGVLLSALPPFITWQMVRSIGWSGTAGSVARWTLPILAAAAVTMIHHLGYWNYRNRILIPVTLGLGLLTTGFLVTASWLTPAIAHIFLHITLLVRGSEMPPVDRSTPTAVPSGTSALHRHAA